MDWMEEVRENLKKRRQILFSKDAACLQPLAAQLAQQPHTVLVTLGAGLGGGDRGHPGGTVPPGAAAPGGPGGRPGLGSRSPQMRLTSGPS